MSDQVAAILLAAGESSRMGRLKQLLPWGDVTLLEWQVSQLREAGSDDVVVVLGHAASEIEDAVPELEARIVINEAYRDGRASSLRAGAAALLDDAGAVLVLSVDQPRPAWVSRALIESWREHRGLLVVPSFEGHAGHPVLVDGRLLGELRAVTEAEFGLRAVVENNRENAHVVPIDNAVINVDLNVPRDYEEAHAQYMQGDWRAVP